MLIKILRSFYFYTLIIMGFFISAAAGLTFSAFTHKKALLFQKITHLWASDVLLLMGMKIKVHGLENIPKNTPVIFAANHQGMMDILIVLACLPMNFRFAIKKELFKIPLYGWYLKKAGYIYIDRAMILSANKLIDAMADILQQGESILIFPEGTRTKTGELGNFKRGSLLAALRAKAPVVPVAISGSFNIIPKGSLWINPCPLKLTVGKPIHINSEEEYETKVLEIRAAVANMLA